MSHTTLHITILTLFPDMFPGPLSHSLTGKALKDGIWSLETVNIREFGIGKHKQVDDTPYGGGAGMVLRPDVVDAAIQEAFRHTPEARLIYMTPRGVPFHQQMACELTGVRDEGRGTSKADVTSSLISRLSSLLFLCGRFEAIDERVIKKYQPLEISLGDFVMTGGELAAMAMIDACVRLLPGVVGEPESLSQESFGLNEDYALLLEHPHYTKPPVWEGMEVPDPLTSGHHAEIDAWRKAKAEEITAERRPDLWQAYQRKKR